MIQPQVTANRRFDGTWGNGISLTLKSPGRETSELRCEM